MHDATISFRLSVAVCRYHSYNEVSHLSVSVKQCALDHRNILYGCEYLGSKHILRYVT